MSISISSFSIPASQKCSSADFTKHTESYLHQGGMINTCKKRGKHVGKLAQSSSYGYLFIEIKTLKLSFKFRGITEIAGKNKEEKKKDHTVLYIERGGRGFVA